MSIMDNKNIFSSFFKRKNNNDKKNEADIPSYIIEDNNTEKSYAEKMMDFACHEKSALKSLCNMYKGKNFNPFEYIDEIIEKSGVTFEYVYRELIVFSHELQFTAKNYLGQINDINNKKDANIKLKVSEDKLSAWIFIFPPFNGGKHITEAQIRCFLEENNISYGVHESYIEKICSKKDYFRVWEIARGDSPVGGRNSYLLCHFAMGSQKKLKICEDETGNLDYKCYSLVHDIRKDDVICEVVPPTAGRKGRDVYGKSVEGKKGNAIHLPRGKNTHITEDGMRLVSDIDGQITYDNHSFNVNKLLIINGDIDSSVGNINFAGDILIRGGIMEGFKVVAEGSINVKGLIDCANIISGGNINAEMGMNGGGKGKLEAKGNIIGKSFENCILRAGGKIFAETIKYSEIYCDDTVNVIDKKGLITGGRIIAANSISARTIGVKTNDVFTEMVLGCTPKMIEQKKAFSAKFSEVSSGIEKIKKNIEYIENLPPNLKSGRMALLEQLRLQIPLREMQKIKLSKMIDKIDEQMNDVSRCFVESGEIYPTTVIKIGSKSNTIKEAVIKSRIFMEHDEITVSEFMNTEIV